MLGSHKSRRQPNGYKGGGFRSEQGGANYRKDRQTIKGNDKTTIE